MDGGPYRAPQPADRRVVNRAESAPRPPAAPVPSKDEAPYRAESPYSRTQKEDRPRAKRRVLVVALSALVILAVALAGWFAWSNTQNAQTGIDGGKYQAVFLANNQVYFGKLSQMNDSYMKMTDVYYLETQVSSLDESELSDQGAADNGSANLVKLGSEVHGPEDEMIISRDQVLFFENLKTDGTVAQSIANYKQQSQ